MKYRLKNISRGPRGVEKAGGGYAWIEPGDTKTIDVAASRVVERDPALEAEPVSELDPPPASLKAKATAKVTQGERYVTSAPKPASKPKRATRRRRKAPTR